MLELDYTNVLDSAVQSHGIPKTSFSKAAESSKALIETLEAARTSGRLGFADLPFDDGPVKAVLEFAREHPFPNVLVLGIGGSALGPMALESGLAAPNSGNALLSSITSTRTSFATRWRLLRPKTPS